MRVLAILPYYVPQWSGGETAAHAWLAELARQGAAVTVVTATRDPQDRHAVEIDGVRVLYDRADPTLPAYVEHERPDILAAQFETARPVVKFAASAGLPVAVFCHGPYGFTELAEADLVDDVDLWVFNSVFLLDLAGRRLPYVVCSPPIDRARCVAARRLPQYGAALVNLFENKGPHVLRGLAERFPDRRFLGVLGGYGRQQTMHDLPNVDHWQNDRAVSRVYASTRVLLMPSREESFGMAAVEAQANGVPVIATDLPSLRESLGEGARFVPRDDLDAWARELARLDDPKEYELARAQAFANAARYDVQADVRWLGAAMAGIARRKHHMASRAEAAQRRAVERRQRVREIFLRGCGREPTPAELSLHADGPETVTALEFIIPRCHA